MSKEQSENSWEQFKVELKKQWGWFSDNDLVAMQEELRRWVDKWFDRYASDIRTSLSREERMTKKLA